MSIHTNRGDINSSPTRRSSDLTNVVTVRVSDDGSPSLSDTKTFTVIVNEVNTAPVLTVPSDQTINELTTLVVNTTAIDNEISLDTLPYSVVSAPGGMTINTNSG